MYCPECGTKNNEFSKFCKNCGTSLLDIENSFTQATQNNEVYTDDTSYLDQNQTETVKSKFLENEISASEKSKEVPEVDSPWYYIAALLWPIGIIVLMNSTADKPILAKQMKEIMWFSLTVTALFFFIIY